MPHGHPHFHPVAVAERFRGGGQVQQIREHHHPLLLHAEGGNLRKRGGFDPPDPALERSFAAPLLHFHRVSGVDGHRIPREDLRLDLDVRRIADL